MFTGIFFAYMMLFRFAMFCCAADATPFGIVVHVGDIEPLKNESWAKVEGVLKISKIRGKDTPVIHVVIDPCRIQHKMVRTNHYR